MAFSLAEAKRRSRQVVHDTMAVKAIFKDTSTSTGIEITARWHSRLVKEGQVERQGAELYENIDQVVFDRNALARIAIFPQRGNKVVFPDYQDLEVSLDVRLKYDGPIEEIWLVTVV